MTLLHASADGAHVEACCATGSSPGDAPRQTLSATLESPRGTYPVRVAYRVYGPRGAPVVAVLGGISAGSRLLPDHEGAPGWWPGVVGQGAALDPSRHRLVAVDWLGGAEDAGAFPHTPTPVDQARALAAVLDHLGHARVTLVGASYGGMVALAFASLFPHRVRHALVLCAAHRAHPMATAVRWVQREVVRLVAGSSREADGVALARALAMTTYRTPAEVETRFGWAAEADGSGPATPRFPVSSYLEHQGRTFSGRFSARAFLRLSESIDLHGVEPATLTPPTTLVSVDADALAPPWLVDELARAAPGVVEHVRLSSVYGHDAFLKESAAVGSLVRRVVDGEVAS